MGKMLEPKNVNLRLERFEYRIVYSKCGRAKYISHLDLMRAIQRAIKRSKLPVWYTQGFNPRIYLMFPLALSLGVESHVEIMDFALVEDLGFEEVKARLDAQMPPDMEVVSVSRPVHKHTDITSAEYEISFNANISSGECKKLFEEYLGQEKIEIEKRSKKKGVNLVDIRPHINVTELAENGEYVKIKMILPAGTGFNLNANVVMDTFFEMYKIECDQICIERTKILMDNGESFT